MTRHKRVFSFARFAVLFFIFAFAFSAHANTAHLQSCTNNSDPQGLANGTNVLFIDQSDCNCNDSGTRISALNPQTPWCTPLAINEGSGTKFIAGDTIFVRQGDYSIPAPATNNNSINIYSSGTPSQRITLKSYPGETATIRGSGLYWRSLIGFFNASYWTIENLNFVGYVNTPSGRLYIPKIMEIGAGQGFEIKNSTFGPIQGNDDIGFGQRWPTDPSKEGWGSVLTFNAISSMTLDNITVSCIDDPSKIAGRIGTLNSDGSLCDNCQNITVTNSRFLDCGHVSLNFRNSSNLLIEKNTFNNRLHTSFGVNTITSNPGISDNITIKNNLFFGANQFPSESNLRGNFIQLGPGGMTNIKIYSNLIYDGYYDVTGIALVGGDLADPASGPINNVQIFNNTIYKTGLRGILMGTLGNTENKVTNVKVYNNIIAESKTDSSIISNPQYEMVISTTNFAQNNGYGSEFKNNLVYTLNSAGTIAHSRYETPASISYTVDTFNATNFADQTIGTNPLFANTNANDFHLQSTSPAINAGTCLTEVQTDFDNKTRSTGGGCSIGAFEYDPQIPAAPICGNGLIEGNETCDNSNLNAKTCVTQGFVRGTISCNSNCTLNTSACSNQPVTQCNDGTDNDSDNKTDYPTDPDCQSTTDTNESNTSITCTENWVCTEWNACANGFQTRTCTDNNHCGTILHTPTTSQTCSADNNQNNPDNNSGDNPNPNNPDNNQNPNIDQNKSNPQTQFALDSTKIVLIAFAVLVVLGATFTAIKSMTD